MENFKFIAHQYAHFMPNYIFQKWCCERDNYKRHGTATDHGRKHNIRIFTAHCFTLESSSVLCTPISFSLFARWEYVSWKDHMSVST